MGLIECFLVTKTDRVGRYLRRYVRTYERPSAHKCLNGYGCDVMFRIEDAPAEPSVTSWERSDPRWPSTCPQCGYVFLEEDEWILFTDPLYENSDGWSWPRRELPAGSMYFPSWLQPEEGDTNLTPGYVCPTEGSVLTVITPEWSDGTGTYEWTIDAYCSNCDRKSEVHHCWCRHGIAPKITVNKVPPPGDSFGTCRAGAGSIWQHMSSGRGWHGMLENGFLRQC